MKISFFYEKRKPGLGDRGKGGGKIRFTVESQFKISQQNSDVRSVTKQLFTCINSFLKFYLQKK